jgi:glycosyltransferase involved in cell wall biosynthesis
MRICAFSRIMGEHRPHYPSLISILSPMFRELGLQVTVLTTVMPDGSSGVRQEGIAEVHYLAGTKADRLDAAFYAASARAFDALHAKRPFDLTFGRGKSVWGFVSQSANAARVPLVLHEGTYPKWLHKIETRFGPLAPAVARALAPAFALKNRETRACKQAAARVVCNSSALAEAERLAVWWQPPRAVPLEYGFDTAPYRVEPPPAGQPPRLIFVGRLTWDKGILPMIDVLAGLNYRTATLEAIGPASPAIQQRLLNHARQSGVADRYSLPGPVRNDELPDHLAGASVFLFPSTHGEGLPKSVLEAMAAGLPVVAYRTKVLEEVVDDGVTGFLVPIRSPRAMAERVDQLLADPALRARMGAAARLKLETKFRPEAINARWRVLLDEVVAEAASRQSR